METNIRETVTFILRDLLKKPNLQFKDNDNPASINGWDSLLHSQAIAAIESNYKIRFSLKDIVKMTTFKEIIEITNKKLIE